MSRAGASTRRSTAQILANMPNHGCEGEAVDEVHFPFTFIHFWSKISYLHIYKLSSSLIYLEVETVAGHPTHTTIGERRTYECRICGKVTFKIRLQKDVDLEKKKIMKRLRC